MISVRPFAPVGMFPSPFFGAGTATSPSVGVVGRFFPSGMFSTDFFTASFFLQDGEAVVSDGDWSAVSRRRGRR